MLLPMTEPVHMQMVRQIDEKHEEGHQRLRSDLRELGERVDELEGRYEENARKIARLENAPPPDVSSLRVTPAVVVMIVSSSLTIAGGMWASTYSLRSDVRDILTRMSQAEKTEEMRARLLEERALVLRDSIDSIKKRQELQSYEIQEINKTILALKSAK